MAYEARIPGKRILEANLLQSIPWQDTGSGMQLLSSPAPSRWERPMYHAGRGRGASSRSFSNGEARKGMVSGEHGVAGVLNGKMGLSSVLI